MKICVFLFLVVLSACNTSRVAIQPATSCNTIVNGKLYASAYQQKAGEYRALCYQAFNLARIRIDVDKGDPSPLPKAIMTDIDETILDNSPYEVTQLLKGKDYDASSWKMWTAKGIADTVPGALHFLQYAFSQGYEIFYVSNRTEADRVGTLQNLQKFNFPNAQNDHLFLRGNESSKETRKQSILTSHNIVMLMGDNLNDLSNLFENKSPEGRMEVVNSFAREFGNRFIVLPNPVYGDWEYTLYNNYSLTPAQKEAVLRKSVKGY